VPTRRASLMVTVWDASSGGPERWVSAMLAGVGTRGADLTATRGVDVVVVATAG